MMTETAKIASFGNDGQCVDRLDARDLSQELIILAVPQQFVRLRFDLIALTDQAAGFVNDHPEHANGRCIKRQRQSNRCTRRLVNKPIAAAVSTKAIDLRKIQRQVVRQDTVLDLGLGPGDRFMCLRQLRHIVDAGPQRIMVDLRRLDPEHVQDHLRKLGIVLVPTVMQSFSCSGECQR